MTKLAELAESVKSFEVSLIGKYDEANTEVVTTWEYYKKQKQKQNNNNNKNQNKNKKQNKQTNKQTKTHQHHRRHHHQQQQRTCQNYAWKKKVIDWYLTLETNHCL